MTASGIKGWEAAASELARCDDRDLRGLLDQLARASGIHGAAGLKYFVGLLRCYAERLDFPVPPKRLKAGEIAYIEQRAKTLLEPYVSDPRCKRMRPLTARKAA